MISNYAGITALCFLLLASTVVAVIPQMSVNSAMLSPAYAQDAESETGPDGDTGSSDEQQQADTGSSDEQQQADTGSSDEQQQADTGSSDEQQQADTATAERDIDPREALSNLQTLARLTGVTDEQGLQEIAGASDSNDLAEMAGDSNPQELAAEPGITDTQALDAIAAAPNLDGLAQLVGMRVQELLSAVLPQQQPPPPPPPADDLAVELSSNYTGPQEAPMTVSFEAGIAGGAEPYDISWDLGDGETATDESSVVHTFTEAGSYTV
ncbi:MAG: PKD domain-containing protein, partial [Nitrososphaera sp.]